VRWVGLATLAFLVQASFAAAAELRVVSFNTAMGLGAKLRSVAAVRELFATNGLSKAHVLSLQEICLNRPEQLALYLQVMQASHRVQYHYSDYASPKLGQGCDKGQAIISAYPMIEAGTLQLPRVGADRTAVWVDLRVEGPGYDRLRIYNLHLSNREKSNYVPMAQRVRQAAPVLDHALEFMRAEPAGPIVVTGDFNSLGALTDSWQREPVLERFALYFQASEASFSSTFLFPYQLDWIFYSNLKLIGNRVVFAALSDHFPVVADFELWR
jgi:endonuclease/exonuclease/phosphatase family metal-dependent hydrolase